jgi:hypothetical protein
VISSRKNIKRVNRKKLVPIETKITSNPIPLTALQSSVGDIVSSFEFTNSPHFNFESHSSNTIPIIVLSKASQIEVRDAIRRTWAFNQFYKNDTIDVQVFFLVGTDDYTINRIRAEQMIFNDVIRVSIPDTNSFMAYKELSAMIWVRSYLPNALFYIKTEEVVIMNINAIVNKLLPVIQSVQNEHLVIGWFGSGHITQRRMYEEFINAVISTSSVKLNYAMSLLYIVTSKASDRMLDLLIDIEFIELPGDLFLTGLLREAAHVQIKNLATDTKDYPYQITNGVCPEELEQNVNLLFCTSSLHFGLQYSMLEYFDAWNKLQ